MEWRKTHHYPGEVIEGVLATVATGSSRSRPAPDVEDSGSLLEPGGCSCQRRLWLAH